VQQFGRHLAARRVVRRTQGRLDVRLAAKLKSHGGTQPAILENVSKKGAKLQISAPPKVGTDAMLHWHGNEVLARVSWTSSTHCGLELYRSLSEELLRATLALDASDRVPDGLNSDEAAAKEWADGRARFGFD
jgi:hypothetical protein